MLFRPQDFSGKYKINKFVGMYHWHEKTCYNVSHVMRVGGYLHYLADHAPSNVRKKWKIAFKKFTRLHPSF